MNDAISSEATEVEAPVTECQNCEAPLVAGQTYQIKSGTCRGDLNCAECAECQRDECGNQIELAG